MFEDSRGSATMIATQHKPARACTGTGNAAALGAADWLHLAAAPTFAIMALLTCIVGSGPPDILCSAAHGASLLSGMVPMYLLMSAFHSAPWLKLISSGEAVPRNPGRGGSRLRRMLGTGRRAGRARMSGHPYPRHEAVHRRRQVLCLSREVGGGAKRLLRRRPGLSGHFADITAAGGHFSCTRSAMVLMSRSPARSFEHPG
jgi:hypothetical protein